MNEADFRASLDGAAPPVGVSPALQALWLAAKGDWDAAHDVTQAGGRDLDWVHAYLHRVEGDEANAGYWYRRAGKPIASGSTEDEWAALVRAMIAEQTV